MRFRIFCIRLALSMGALFLSIGCSPSPSPSTPTSPTTTPPVATTALSTALFVPLSEAPQIDGEMQPDEWDAAITETFADSSQLFLMRDENYLYLAIRSATQEMIAANVYFAKDDTISIHHASAALGTGIYQKEADDWLKTQDFLWRCRATNNSDASIAERDAFLEDEGWLAANSRIGTPNELEYKFKIREENLLLAVVFMRTSEPDLRIYFPIDLADSTTQPTPDGLPETQLFSPDSWLMLDLANLQ